MVSFQEITDLAVLSYGMNFINDAECLLLYNWYSSESLYLPYDLYPEFAKTPLKKRLYIL